jgi:hypothetical protein
MIGRAMPSMLNYITGREVVPEAHADSQIIESLALKVTPQHLQLLVGSGMVTQEEAMLLAARFSKVKEEAEKRKAALHVIPPEDKENEQAKPA